MSILTTCRTCGATYSFYEDCDRCDRIQKGFRRDRGEAGGDADYALHELAHFILLFRRVPRRRRDWTSIETTINKSSPGRSQLHELRALALECAGWRALGWKTSLERIVKMGWYNVNDLAEDTLNDLKGHPSRKRWTSLVRSRSHMMRLTKDFIGEVSPRNLALWTNTVRRWIDVP